MKRYSIMGRQFGSDREMELAQVDSNPQALLDALKAKSVTITSEHKRVHIPKYTWLRIVEHE